MRKEPEAEKRGGQSLLALLPLCRTAYCKGLKLLLNKDALIMFYSPARSERAMLQNIAGLLLRLGLYLYGVLLPCEL